MQCVAVCCCVIQCVAARCNVLQCLMTHSYGDTQGRQYRQWIRAGPREALYFDPRKVVAGATHCIILQHTAKHFNTMRCNAPYYHKLQHVCIPLRDHTKRFILILAKLMQVQHTATHCNTLQHTAIYCNTLQHTATHCTQLQYDATQCNMYAYTCAYMFVFIGIP